MSPNPAKAPWYFMGIQELLLHFHPLFAVVVLPLVATLALLVIPYFSYEDDPSGIWFVSRSGRSLAKAAALAALVLTPALVVLDEWVLDLPGWLPWLPPVISNGVIPTAVLGVLAWGGYLWLRTRRSATTAEVVQTAFVFFAVAFAVLTAVGVWFRTEGMALGL
jgi:hypothetical protein